VGTAIRAAIARIVVAGGGDPGRPQRDRLQRKLLQFGISHHLANDFAFLRKLTRFELGIELPAVFEHFEAAIAEWN
jgi:hypothetical protein